MNQCHLGYWGLYVVDYGSRGLIIRNGSDWPTLFLSNDFTALKGTHFYAPNFEKVGSILLSACPFVRSSVCLSVRSKKNKARVLKFHI